MKILSKSKIDCIVVIPIGPRCRYEYITDTIDSIKYYFTSSYKVIIVDDSGIGLGNMIQRIYKDCDVLNTKCIRGINSGLYVTLSEGYLYALNNYDFKVILRLDTDALITGFDPDKDAINYFKANPNIGIIGSFRIDCNGNARSFQKVKNKIVDFVNCYKYFIIWGRKRRNARILKEYINVASRNGYELGEHCIGGAVFISAECVKRLAALNLLMRVDIPWQSMQEDHIFGLLINIVGMKHGDFATDGYPMALRWKGMPCEPCDIIRNKKKIVHSTKYYGNLKEDYIREYFRKYRK